MWIQWWHVRSALLAVVACVPVLASVPEAVFLAERGNKRHAKLGCIMTNAY